MAYVPGVALLAVLAAGCSAGSDGDATDADSKPGGPTVTSAPPGKYRTLPAPCRAVPRGTLRDLLPGAVPLPEDQQERIFRGTPSVTYDTDRKVGCTWKADAPDASRNLSIDFERVVSYDPAVSDDDRAAVVYAKKEEAAGLSSASAPSAGTGGGKPGSGGSADAQDPDSTASAPGSPPASGSSGTAGDDGGDLRPRVLGGLGNAAFLDDQPTRAGSAAQQRTVSVVFRTSNVIVTVRYAEQPALVTKVPDSGELQEKAQALARKLAEAISE
ncbi:hypothetical protein EES43_12005 [Streptomyces sp. ADI96-02]|uniref:DUF3558 domain-containing protein n=1 Tax=Streptomyces sp. ADI96-02 TaxID=1522760 RepID=UPI000F54D884|nr:DUF3558 domain-containing protein [Streptomyces sp. ADI96-02]RPK63250.1 hypothetical protein EES43_12005 [Streptomyces sp. ADI96-02]